MIVLIGQILGCLLVAAGIGGVVGWFLRQTSPGPHTQEFEDTNTALSLKEEMLESAQFELKVQAAGMTGGYTSDPRPVHLFSEGQSMDRWKGKGGKGVT